MNALNKQLCTADKGWSFTSVLGEGLTVPGHKHPAVCYELLHRVDGTTRKN